MMVNFVDPFCSLTFKLDFIKMLQIASY